MPMRTIFDHVAKTAGTSVKEAIATAIGERGELVDQGYPHHILVTNAGRRRFIGAHMWFYPGERLAADWYYSAVVRDPLDRFLSHYYFYRLHRQHVLSGMTSDPAFVAAAMHRDLDSYLSDSSTDVRRTYTNFQSHHFACRMCDRPDDLNDGQLLDAAIASLEEYDLVGVYSDLQGFVDVYCHDLSVPTVLLPRLNITAERKSVDDLPKALRDKLAASNAVDAALCNWAIFHSSRRRLGGASIRSVGSRQAAPEAAAVSFGTKEIQIVSVTCQRRNGEVPQVASGERVDVLLTCLAKSSEADLTVGIAIRNSEGNIVGATNTKFTNTRISIAEPQEFTIHIGFAAALAAGDYKIAVALHKGLVHFDGCYHWLDDAARFRVGPGLNADGNINASIVIAIEEMKRHAGALPHSSVSPTASGWARPWLGLMTLGKRGNGSGGRIGERGA